MILPRNVQNRPDQPSFQQIVQEQQQQQGKTQRQEQLPLAKQTARTARRANSSSGKTT